MVNARAWHDPGACPSVLLLKEGTGRQGVSRKPRLNGWVFLVASGCAPLICAQAAPQQRVAVIYKAAEADYAAGRYAEAADRLEAVLPSAPRSFEVHELLGLVYASMSEHAKALSQLQLAV